MKTFWGNNLLVKSSFLLLVFCAAFTTCARAGLDFYEIYLGKQLLMKRYVNQPLSLSQLPLSNAKSGDQLVIHYYQCNMPDKLGVNRSIAIKDDNGAILKEWKFANAKGTNTGMAILVNELLQWQKKSNGRALSLFYNADGRRAGETLALLATGKEAVSYLPEKAKPAQSDIARLLFLALSLYR